jgi:hypothetical protein
MIGILSLITVAHKELLKLSEEKKDILIKNDRDALEVAVSSEETVLKKIQNLEQQRESITEKIAHKLGIKAEEAKIEKIIENAQGQAKHKLIEVKMNLVDVIGKIARVNDINKELIKTHLDYTYFSLEVMMRGGDVPETYNGNGYMSGGEAASIGLIDQKV